MKLLTPNTLSDLSETAIEDAISKINENGFSFNEDSVVLICRHDQYYDQDGQIYSGVPDVATETSHLLNDGVWFLIDEKEGYIYYNEGA